MDLTAKATPAKRGRKRTKPADDESDKETCFYPVLPTWPRIDPMHTYNLALSIIDEVVSTSERNF